MGYISIKEWRLRCCRYCDSDRGVNNESEELSKKYFLSVKELSSWELGKELTFACLSFIVIIVADFVFVAQRA